MSMVLVHQQFLELTREEGYPPRNLVLGNQLLSMNGFNYIIIMIPKYLPDKLPAQKQLLDHLVGKCTKITQ